jgi:hypothetical protein
MDSKIKVIEEALLHRRKLYAAYLMDQQARRQERSKHLESLSKPIDLNQINQLVKSRSVSVEQVSSLVESPTGGSPKSIVQAATLPHVSERDELIGVRRRINRPEKAMSMRDGDQPVFHATHDQLASDLVVLAKNLKQNNLAFQNLLVQDKSVIKETELLLNTNAAKFSREHEGLKTFRSASWRSTKTTILMMFLLFAVFIFMYLLIKVTSK